MMQPTCVCEHERRDHRRPRTGTSNFGECKVCLCPMYKKHAPPAVTRTEISDYSSLQSNAPVIEWILERLERKESPQGLKVIAEELHWLGQGSITHERLLHAVAVELRRPHPRIEAVAEGVYWFADKRTPVGWTLFGDRRMLPCFYREYPPEISWEKLDEPENILPSPEK